MGIHGLLPHLKNIIERKHVSKFAGSRVAVDTYGWLHKGTYCCALELCTGAPTDKYITYCVERVKMLQKHGVIPIMVFDGANLPSKGGTEQQRRSSREVNHAKGMQYLRNGNRDKAVECFQRAVDVTPAMAQKLIRTLKKMSVECLVAPYEADAQVRRLEPDASFLCTEVCIRSSSCD
jgi:exonuclease-1